MIRESDNPSKINISADERDDESLWYETHLFDVNETVHILRAEIKYYVESANRNVQYVFILQNSHSKRHQIAQLRNFFAKMHSHTFYIIHTLCFSTL